MTKVRDHVSVQLRARTPASLVTKKPNPHFGRTAVAHKLAAGAGSYALSGLAASFLIASRRIVASAGSYILSGSTVGLMRSAVRKNLNSDYGAIGDGIADDSVALNLFNDDYLAAGPNANFELTINAGTYALDTSTSGSNSCCFARGPGKLVVIGAGSINDATPTIIKRRGVGFFPGSASGGTIAHDNLHSSRIATVSAGSTTVQLLTLAEHTRYSVGAWIMVAGFDMQGGGYPLNPHFFEYVKVTAKDTGTGVITFTPALKFGYKSTWPVYAPGDASNPDNGGPATIYAVNAGFDGDVEYRDLHIDNGANQTTCDGRKITFTNVTVEDSLGVIASQNMEFNAADCDWSNVDMEADKIVDTINLTNTQINRISFQSSSINTMNVTGCTFSGSIDGTPKVLNATDSTINDLKIGAHSYGASSETNATNCIISNLTKGGVVTNVTTMSMSGGVITIAPGGPQPAFIPGALLTWRGQYDSELSFRVVDVTQPGGIDTEVYIQTSLSGGFPAVPRLTGTDLFVQVHPAPQCTFVNCTGCQDVVDLSLAPAGLPLYSYYKRTFTKDDIGHSGATTDTLPIWGAIQSIKYTVNTAYAGSNNPLTFHGMSIFDNYPTIKSDGSVHIYDAIIDLRTAGVRTITPTTPATPLSGQDANLSIPEAVWFHGSSGLGASANISGETTSLSVTMEIVTDQGF